MVRKSFQQLSRQNDGGYRYFRSLLSSHVEQWRPRIPEPHYENRDFIFAELHPRTPRPIVKTSRLRSSRNPFSSKDSIKRNILFGRKTKAKKNYKTINPS